MRELFVQGPDELFNEKLYIACESLFGGFLFKKERKKHTDKIERSIFKTFVLSVTTDIEDVDNGKLVRYDIDLPMWVKPLHYLLILLVASIIIYATSQVSSTPFHSWTLLQNAYGMLASVLLISFLLEYIKSGIKLRDNELTIESKIASLSTSQVLVRGELKPQWTSNKTYQYSLALLISLMGIVAFPVSVNSTEWPIIVMGAVFSIYMSLGAITPSLTSAKSVRQSFLLFKGGAIKLFLIMSSLPIISGMMFDLLVKQSIQNSTMLQKSLNYVIICIGCYVILNVLYEVYYNLLLAPRRFEQFYGVRHGFNDIATRVDLRNKSTKSVSNLELILFSVVHLIASLGTVLIVVDIFGQYYGKEPILDVDIIVSGISGIIAFVKSVIGEKAQIVLGLFFILPIILIQLPPLLVYLYRFGAVIFKLLAKSKVDKRVRNILDMHSLTKIKVLPLGSCSTFKSRWFFTIPIIFYPKDSSKLTSLSQDELRFMLLHEVYHLYKQKRFRYWNLLSTCCLMGTNYFRITEDNVAEELECDHFAKSVIKDKQFKELFQKKGASPSFAKEGVERFIEAIMVILRSIAPIDPNVFHVRNELRLRNIVEHNSSNNFSIAEVLGTFQKK